MIIEADAAELVRLFGDDVKLNCGSNRTRLSVNDVAFVVDGYDSWTDYNSMCRGGPITTYKIYMSPIVKQKSPQEVAAEEAVQKAESALKAAKDVLKTVKEK